MMEQAAGARKSLTLDTDWMSFVMAVVGSCLSLLLAISIWSDIIRGTPVKVGVSWQTTIPIVYGVLFAIGKGPRALRYGAATIAITTASRIALHLLNAPASTQIVNAQLERIVHGVVWAAVFLGSCLWFRKILVLKGNQD